MGDCKHTDRFVSSTINAEPQKIVVDNEKPKETTSITDLYDDVDNTIEPDINIDEDDSLSDEEFEEQLYQARHFDEVIVPSIVAVVSSLVFFLSFTSILSTFFEK